MLSRTLKGYLAFFKALSKYKRLEWLAYHDSLTSLKNRNWLYENIDNIKCKYIYFLDINGLHEINKKGHIIGDQHIKDIADKLKYLVTPGSIIVRYAGDEFIIFANDICGVETNNEYSVGVSENKFSIKESIKLADLDMIKNKNAKTK